VFLCARSSVGAPAASKKVQRVPKTKQIAQNKVELHYAPVAQLDRALACGAKGHKFESCRAHQNRIFFYLTVFKTCFFIKAIKSDGV
jgi:hypothetical protein